MSDFDTTDGSVDRRSVLVGVSGLTAGVAGCSSVSFFGDEDSRRTGSDDSEDKEGGTESPSSALVFEGFEDGSFTQTFTDNSQSAAEPAVTTVNPASGEYALDLSADPGGSTGNIVITSDSFTGDKAYSVLVEPYVIDGFGGKIAVRLVHTRSAAEIIEQVSMNHNGVSVLEKQTDGNQVGPEVQLVDEVLPDDEYTELAVRVESADKITCRVGQITKTFSTDADWTSKEIQVELRAGAWQSGAAHHARFDDFRVSNL